MNSSYYYIYYLIDPRNNQPFYVGKGRHVPGRASRWRSHIIEASSWDRKSGNLRKLTIIQEILTIGVEPEVQIVDKVDSENEAFKLEQQCISKMGRLVDGSGILTNLTKGGEGITSFKEYSDEELERRRNRMLGKNNPMFGKNHSDKSKQKMSNTRCRRLQDGIIIPKKHTRSHKDNLSKERRLGDLTKKAVCQISLETGLIIHVFESTRQAGKQLNISSWRNISHKCNVLKNQIVGGYYWRWENDVDLVTGKLENVKMLNLKRNGKPVNQLDTNKNILKQWNCIKDISAEFNRAPSTITKWLKVDRMFDGFYWEYV